jgi:hypothetical protein
LKHTDFFAFSTTTAAPITEYTRPIAGQQDQHESRRREVAGEEDDRSEDRRANQKAGQREDESATLRTQVDPLFAHDEHAPVEGDSPGFAHSASIVSRTAFDGPCDQQ